MHGSLHVTIPLLICAEPKGQIVGINFVPNSVSAIQYSSIKIGKLKNLSMLVKMSASYK